MDDNKTVRRAISKNLGERGFSPIEASNGREALEIFQKEKPDSVLVDLRMPDMDGIETLQKLKEIDPGIPIIIITGHGDIPTAVEAIKLGAYEFVVKPPDFDRLVLILRRATEKCEMDRKIKMLSSDIKTSLEYLLGNGASMKKVIQDIHRISHSDFSLVIQGETGTGKSFIARIIHNLSKRANGPFVSVDIGSIPEPLIESELFGYEKGAFTGAEKKKKGFFEIADRGTLIIDEMQNMSPYVQSKLLMAAEGKYIIPLGSTCPIKTDVRIIGATNTDILKAVKEEKIFREDLFYRLGEFMIFLPPLRERVEDIPAFANKFIMEAAEDLNKPMHSISEVALDLLEKYSWPGNIRELKNVVRRAVLLSDEGVIKPENIKFLMKKEKMPQTSESYPAFDAPSVLDLKKIEELTIKKAMDVTKGNKTKAALLLNISYVTLFKKIKDYSIY